MPDINSGKQEGLEAPASNAEVVIPHDVTNLGNTCRSIFVGTGGDVSVEMAGEGSAIVHKNLPSGSTLTVRATRVNATGTTASDLVSWY